MQKRLPAILIALTFACLNLGDKKPAGAAQPLEVQSAVRIPGPNFVIQQPLELSIDQRLDAQQIQWECRVRETFRAEARIHRNSTGSAVEENPLPVLSAALSDIYRCVSGG